MEKKILNLLLLFIVTITLGAGIASARPEYLSNFSAIYGDGSCATCHVSPGGGGPLNSYGTLFQSQPNYATDPAAALRAIGAPPTSALTTPEVTQVIATETPPEVTPEATATQKSPGFGIALSIAALCLGILIARGRN